MMVQRTHTCRSSLLLAFLFRMEGESARAAGLPLLANPYEPETDQYQLWAEGWHAQEGARQADQPRTDEEPSQRAGLRAR